MPRPEAQIPTAHAELETALAAHRDFGQLNPRGAGLHNQAIQLVKKIMRRSLSWYTRPNQLFQAAMIRAVRQTGTALQKEARRIDELQIENAALWQEVSTLHTAFRDNGVYVATMPGAGARDGKRPARSYLLKENEEIVSYWDGAAERDPMHETVTQWDNESDDDYRTNWNMIGEYISSKILANSPPNPIALEIGPGMGRISMPMSRHCKSILALDISPKMAACAREAMAGASNFNVDVITDEDLSFLPAESFDLAYSIACFQHANKKTFYRYLRGVRRALKTGGVFFFNVMNLCSEEGWKHFAAILTNDYPQFFHTPDEIACYLDHAGYSSHNFEHEGETMWVVCHR